MNNIFDTHAHYSSRQFDADRAELLTALPAGGVVGVLECATHSGDAAQVLELAHAAPYFHAALGIHLGCYVHIFAASAGLALAEPRVCANNAAMIELGLAHLRENGVQHLAGFSLLRYRGMPWAEERLQAFRDQAGAQPCWREAVSTPAAVWIIRNPTCARRWLSLVSMTCSSSMPKA